MLMSSIFHFLLNFWLHKKGRSLNTHYLGFGLSNTASTFQHFDICLGTGSDSTSSGRSRTRSKTRKRYGTPAHASRPAASNSTRCPNQADARKIAAAGPRRARQTRNTLTSSWTHHRLTAPQSITLIGNPSRIKCCSAVRSTKLATTIRGRRSNRALESVRLLGALASLLAILRRGLVPSRLHCFTLCFTLCFHCAMCFFHS